jgi:hypothetical protein
MNKVTNEQAVLLLSGSVVANEVGDAFTRGEYLKHFVQVTVPDDGEDPGTPVAIQLQVSGDSVTWFDLGAPVSAPGFAHVDGFYPWIRAKRDNTSNPVTVRLESGWSQPR